MLQPRFITFEGGEGAGKSTQIKQLAQFLTSRGIECIVTREPGGSAGAEAIRSLVVSGAVDRWHPSTEALLFMAARLDHIETLIKPTLAKGQWVLCDRFYDSTYVYQGIAKHVGTEWLDTLYSLLYGNLVPDLTLLLDIDPKLGLKRAHARGNTTESRFEAMGIAYHQRLREGFLTLAKRDAARVHIVDAAATPAQVHQSVVNYITTRFTL